MRAGGGDRAAHRVGPRTPGRGTGWVGTAGPTTDVLRGRGVTLLHPPHDHLLQGEIFIYILGKKGIVLLRI